MLDKEMHERIRAMTDTDLQQFMDTAGGGILLNTGLAAYLNAMELEKDGTRHAYMALLGASVLGYECGVQPFRFRGDDYTLVAFIRLPNGQVELEMKPYSESYRQYSEEEDLATMRRYLEGDRG